MPYGHTCGSHSEHARHGLCAGQSGQGALPGLVALLKRYVPFIGPPNPGASVVRRAADAITNLAHENVNIKSRVRTEGGIPPLVSLLESYDAKVPARAGSLSSNSKVLQ